MITVINLHDGGVGEYIGRPSILGNPYVLGVDGTRADCVDKYEDYFLEKLENDPKFRKEFERLVGRTVFKFEDSNTAWLIKE